MTAKAETTAVATAPHVLQAIAAVMADIGKEGIAKDRNNQQQGYRFRGVDDVYNALNGFLAQRLLVITPICKSRTCDERQTKSGSPLFYVTVEADFRLSSAVDGSSIVATTFGEAMDSADKATNKAMSAAYKYMAMQQFCIPTEGDNDADASHHDLAPKHQAQPQQRTANRGDFAKEPAPAERSPAAVDAAKAAIVLCSSKAALDKWTTDNVAVMRGLHEEDRAEVRAALTARLEAVRPAPATQTKPAEADPFQAEAGIVTAMKAAIGICENRLALDKWADENKPHLDKLPDDDYAIVLAFWKARGEALRPQQVAA